LNGSKAPIIALAVDTATERIPVGGGAAGSGERRKVDVEVVDVGGGVISGCGPGLYSPALAHTFAAALLASHPAAVIS